MDRQQIRTRILDNLSWAVLQGTMPKPPEPLPVWPRLLELWPEPADEFVRGAFNILFERDPDVVGREHFRQYLNNGGSRVTMIAELADSDEARLCHTDQAWRSKLEMLTPEWILEALQKSWEKPAEAFLTDSYDFILGREADAEGLNARLGLLADGQPRSDIIRMLAESVEYKNRGIASDWVKEFDDRLTRAAQSLRVWTQIKQLWPEPTGEFILGAYQLLLNRQPNDTELQSLGRYLDESSRAALVAELADSEEARTHIFDLSWVSQLPLLTPEGVRSTLLANWSIPTLQFVDLSYRIMLDRSPDPAGLRSCLVLLANGGTKEEMIRRLAGSAEYTSRGISADWINEPETFSAKGDLLERSPVWPRIKQLWALPTEEFIHGVYRVLFKRDADAAGLAGFREFLNKGGARATMVAELANADETRVWSKDQSWLVRLEKMTPQWIRTALRQSWKAPTEQFIQDCYQIVLDRPATSEEMRSSLGLLVDGKSRGDLVRIIAASGEYQARGIAADWVEGIDGFSPEGAWAEITHLLEQPDEAFVRGLYRLLFDRLTPRHDELELHFSALKQGIARADVIREFAHSEEATHRQLDLSWLDRLEDVPEPITIDPRSVIVAERSRLFSIRDRREFVRSAYQCLLGREPSEGDLKGQARRIRIIPFYRRHLLKKLMDSHEAQTLIRKSEQQELSILFAAQKLAVRELIERTEHRSELRSSLRNSRQSDSFTRLAEGQAHSASSLAAVSEAVTLLQDSLRDQLSQSVSDAAQRDHGLHQTLTQIEQRLEPLAKVQDLERLERATASIALSQEKSTLSILNEQEKSTASILNEQEKSTASILNEQVKSTASIAVTQEQAQASRAQIMAEIQDWRQSQTDLTEPVEAILNQLNELVQRQTDLQTAQTTSLQAHGESALRDETIRELLTYVREAQDGLAQREDAMGSTLAYIRQTSELQWFAQDRQLDQLRRLMGNLGPQPTPALAPVVSENHSCRICGGELKFRFTAKVLHDRYDADYFECKSCHALQIPNPTWLGEAYANEDGPQVWNPDRGRFVRNFSACSWLKALQDAELIPSNPRVLDFGGGYGMLVQMLRNAGFDAWQWDPEVPVPMLAPTYSIANFDEVPNESFDVVCAFEVFEHLTDPIDVGEKLRRILRPGGLFFLSTLVYKPERDGPDWFYLSKEAGQHVTFWSKQALGWFAARFGFQSIGYFQGNGVTATVMADVKTPKLREALERVQESVHNGQNLEFFIRAWKLDIEGFGVPIDELDIHPIYPLGEPS